MAILRIQDLDNTWIYHGISSDPRPWQHLNIPWHFFRSKTLTTLEYTSLWTGIYPLDCTSVGLVSYFVCKELPENSYRIEEGTLEHLQRCSLCDPAKIFFTSKFSYLLFCTHKTETGRANRWGTSNSKPSGPIIMMGQSESLGSTHFILLHSFLPVESIGAPLTSHCALRHYAQPKPISWSNLAYFDFSSSDFTVQGHILSTTGDALKHKVQWATSEGDYILFWNVHPYKWIGWEKVALPSVTPSDEDVTKIWARPQLPTSSDTLKNLRWQIS
jgi:hypothetical protein